MARDGYTPVPQVEARTSAPDDLQHIETSPNAFGAQLAQGVGEIGAGVTKAADFYGQVAGTQAVNNAITQATNILHGDANKATIGPDGQSVPDTGFFGMRGADAMRARQSTSQAIQNIITQNGASLTPEARERYEGTIRRYQAEWEGQIGSYADQQQHVWSMDTNNTSAQLALTDLGRDPGNADLYSNVEERVKGAYFKNAQLNGASTEGALLKAKQDVAFSQVRALLPKDPLAAWNALKGHMDLIATMPGTYGLQQEAKVGALDNMVGTLSDPAYVAAVRSAGAISSGTGTGTIAPGKSFANMTFDQVKPAIIQHESGGNYNAIVGAKPGGGNQYGFAPQNLTGMTMGQVYDYQRNVMLPATKGKPLGGAPDASYPGTSAVGAYQLVSGTLQHNAQAIWGDKWRDQPFSPGNQDKIAEHIYNATHGDDAKLLAQWPSLKGKGGQQGNSSSVDAFTATGSEDNVLALARAKLQQAGFGPGEVERGVRQIESNIKRDDSEQIARVTGTVADSVSYLTNGGDPSKITISPTGIQASLPGPKGQALAHSLQSAMDTASAMRLISSATPQQVQQILADHKPTGPQDYEQKEQAYSNIALAADRRQKMLLGDGKNRGDPAAYVNQFNPDIDRSLTASVNGAKPDGLTGYIGKTLAAQAQLGVPPEMQAVLPNSMAQGIVHRLQTVSPQDAFKSLANLQSEAGSNFSYVYRDLVRAGLSTNFQAAMLAGSFSPQNGATMIAASQHDAELRGEGKSSLADQASKIMFGGKPITGLVDKALSTDAGMANLRQAYGVAGRAGLDSFNGIQQAVRNTAFYLYMKGSAPDPVTATVQAAKMVAGNYDFVSQGSHPPVQLPKGQTQAFQQATQFVLRQLHLGDVRPYPAETTQDGHVITRSESDRTADAFHSAQHAYWVSVPGHDGKGAVQAFDPATGTPVIIKNGMPLLIPIAQLNAVAARNAAFAAYGLGAH